METERLDVRKLEPAGREQGRRIARRLPRQGHSQTAIAEELGLRRATVSGWLAQARAGHGVKAAQRGRPLGQGRKLTPAQEQRLRPDIVELTPDQRKLSFALRKAQAVRALIKVYFAIDLPVRSVRNYLKRWGFTPPRPVKRAFAQKPQAVQTWLTEEYPTLAVRAKREGAHICWGEETAVSSLAHYPRGYAPKGQPPGLLLSRAKRQRSNLLSAITNQGTLRCRLYRHPLRAPVRIKFLERLIREADQKGFLILDNLRVHHSVKVPHWLADKRERIELFFLPSYAPELHPDEYLNADLKASRSAAEPVRSGSHLRRKVLAPLRSLPQQPARVRSYFKADPIKDAA